MPSLPKYCLIALGSSLLLLAGVTMSGCSKKQDPRVLTRPPALSDAPGIYAQNGCGACHGQMKGGGATKGPDLAHEGTKRGPDLGVAVYYISEHIRNPATHTPGSIMPAYKDKIAYGNVQALATALGKQL